LSGHKASRAAGASLINSKETIVQGADNTGVKGSDTDKKAKLLDLFDGTVKPL